MAGDLVGPTILTGLIVTPTPGSGVTTTGHTGPSSYIEVQSGGTLSVQSGAQLSLATFSFSIATAASATAIPSGNLGIVFRASGISLVYVSGSTVYSFGSSSYSGVA